MLLITGITGFLGGWVGKYALEQCSQHFKIRASVRSLEKAKVLKETYGKENYKKIEWVQADISDDKQMIAAMENVTHMIHVASPVPNAKHKVSNKEMVAQATAGMKTILDCALNFKLKKLVVTSSIATINGGCFKGKKDTHYSELDFSYGKPN